MVTMRTWVSLLIYFYQGGGSCGWWMSIPASRSSIYPLPPLCNLYNLLKEMVTDSSTQTFYAASLG